MQIGIVIAMALTVHRTGPSDRIDRQLTARGDAIEGQKGNSNQSCVKFIQEPSAVPKWQFSPSKLLKTVT
jgi:hypothetical protein